MFGFASKLVFGSYWRLIRPLLPRRPTQWAGINSHESCGVLDHAVLPIRYNYKRDRPNYESALVYGLSKATLSGDRVLIVGGGYGITAVLAARLSQCKGRVTVYEASSLQTEICKSVFNRNTESGTISISNKVVGKAISVLGGIDDAVTTIAPQDLPECDVLQLDCEGAEHLILSSMTIRPRDVLVETHGHLGAPTQKIAEILIDLGYEVRDLGLAEIDFMEACLENDIRVLWASSQLRETN